ncbi:MAG: hypothetical protein Q7K57_44810 [Burkholderiaceae bacterium]|nr:hypothetical protein [Burkholderiaceae bacterium]
MSLCAGGVDKVENLQWLTVVDHRTKTRQDLRVCRYLRKIPQEELDPHPRGPWGLKEGE